MEGGGAVTIMMNMAGWRLPLVLALLSAAPVRPAIAQSVPGSAAPTATIVPVHLPQATYPPIAQSARVQGDVEVTVNVRPDGSVAEAALTATSWPLLGPAALAAAKNATFECRGCAGPTLAVYSIVYAFKMDGGSGPAGNVEQPIPVQESLTRSRVTTVVEMLPIQCIYRTPIVVSVRSAKCAWLWKCGYGAVR